MGTNTDKFGYDFSRQEAFASLGTVGQARLKDAGILIVGVGGLGSWCSELLARMGIGRLRLVDADKVEPSNLPRQALYSPEDINRPKALVAAEELKRLCPHLDVESEVTRLNAHNVDMLAEGMDVIVDATDDWATRFLLNDFSSQQQRSWVFGGVVGAEGQVMTIRPGKSACLRCLFDSPPPAAVEQAYKASVVGVLAPAVAMIASIQALEAIKLIVNPETSRSGLLKFNLWTNTFQELTGRHDPACPCCGQGKYEFLSKINA